MRTTKTYTTLRLARTIVLVTSAAADRLGRPGTSALAPTMAMFTGTFSCVTAAFADGLIRLGAILMRRTRAKPRFAGT